MTVQAHKPKTDKQVLSRGYLSFFQFSGTPSYAGAMEILTFSRFGLVILVIGRNLEET
jgi:hypothetical protein